jgi:hypothetical protein
MDVSFATRPSSTWLELFDLFAPGAVYTGWTTAAS